LGATAGNRPPSMLQFTHLGGAAATLLLMDPSQVLDALHNKRSNQSTLKS
jgi:hypothetical protein